MLPKGAIEVRQVVEACRICDGDDPPPARWASGVRFKPPKTDNVAPVLAIVAPASPDSLQRND